MNTSKHSQFKKENTAQQIFFNTFTYFMAIVVSGIVCYLALDVR